MPAEELFTVVLFLLMTIPLLCSSPFPEGFFFSRAEPQWQLLGFAPFGLRSVARFAVTAHLHFDAWPCRTHAAQRGTVEG